MALPAHVKPDPGSPDVAANGGGRVHRVQSRLKQPSKQRANPRLPHADLHLGAGFSDRILSLWGLVLLETAEGAVFFGDLDLIGALGQIFFPDFRVQQLEFQEVATELLSDRSQVPLRLLDVDRDRLSPLR